MGGKLVLSDGLVIDSRCLLNLGDFFASKHSNLAGTEVVHHLIYEKEDVCSFLILNLTEQLNSDSLNARSPIFGGLRNLIRHTFENGIRQLSIPLLLVNNFDPEVVSLYSISSYPLENEHEMVPQAGRAGAQVHQGIHHGKRHVLNCRAQDISIPDPHGHLASCDLL